MTPNNNNLDQIERQLIRIRRMKYRDFPLFRRYYFQDYNMNDDAPFHRELADLLGKAVLKRGFKIALAAPRESGKSTIITLQFIVYVLCYHLEDCVVLIGSTADQAAEYLTHIKTALATNARLKKDFPEVCELDKKPEPIRWAQREIITKNNIKVIALSVGQNIRGKRHNQFRPGLVVIDDIEGNDMVQNEDSRYKLKDWLEKSVLKVGHNGTNFIFAGTIHHYGSLLAQYTNPDVTPGWEGRIYRSIIKWSDATKEWETWTNIFRGHIDYMGRTGPEAAREYFEDNEFDMLDETEVLWPQKKSYYQLMEMRETEGPISFDSEMQNEPVNPRDCFFNLDELHYWDKQFPSEEALIASIQNPQFVMACDPSLGKNTTHGDYSAILVGVKDVANNKLYIVCADIQRRKPENLIETILGYAKSWKITKLGVEANHFQQLLVDDLKKRAAAAGISLSIKAIENRTNKIARIQALEPALKTGHILFNKKHHLLLEQLKYFPKGQHDDGPDALEMLFDVAGEALDWAAVNQGYINLVNMLKINYLRQNGYL